MLESNTLLASCLLLVWLASVLGSGLRCLEILRIAPLRAFGRLALALGLGTGVYAMTMLGLGLTSLLYPVSLYSLLVVLLLYGWSPLIRWCKDTWAHGSSIQIGVKEVLGIVAAGAVMLCGYVMVFVPPIFFDAVVSGLGLPLQYMIRHEITYFSSFHYSAMPQNAQMVYAFGLGIGNTTFAQLISLSVCWMVALNAGAIADHMYPQSGATSLILVSSIPMTLFLGAHAGTDQFVALFVLGAIYAAMRWNHSPSARALLLVGIFIGFAIGTKYTGVYLVLPIIAVWGATGTHISLWFRQQKGRAWRMCAIAIAVAVLLGGPWYIRNIINTSNPVYPAFYSVLGGTDWSAEQAEIVSRDVEHGGGRSLTFETVLMLPWDLVVHPTKFGSSGFIGVAFWGILFLALYAMIQLTTARRIGLYCVLVLPFWLGTSLNLRYIFPVVVLCYLLSAIGLDHLVRRVRQPRLGLLAIGVIVTLNVALFVYIEERIYQPSLLLTGTLTPEAYTTHWVPHLPIAEYVKEHHDPTTQILLIGESRVLYWPRAVIPSSAYDRAYIVTLTSRVDTVEELACLILRDGITHVALNAAEAERLTQHHHHFSWDTMEDEAIYKNLGRYLRLEKASPYVSLFTVVAPPTCPVASRTTTRRG